MLDSDVIKPFNSPWTTGSVRKEKRWDNDFLHGLSKFKPSHERRCLPLAWCDKILRNMWRALFFNHLDLVRGLLGSGDSQRTRRDDGAFPHLKDISNLDGRMPFGLFCRQWIQSLTNWTGKTAWCIWTKFCISKEFGWTCTPANYSPFHAQHLKDVGVKLNKCF